MYLVSCTIIVVLDVLYEPSGVLPPMLSIDPRRPKVCRKIEAKELAKGGKKRTYQFMFVTCGFHTVYTHNKILLV